MGFEHERIAHVAETGEGRFLSEVRIGAHKMLADEPPALGGDGRGPDPFEFVLAGLGACTAMTIRLYAERKGWPLSKVEVEVRHAARLSEGAARDVFDRTIRLDGDLSAEERERLVSIAGRCPVSRTLAAGAEVTARLADTPEAGAATG